LIGSLSLYRNSLPPPPCCSSPSYLQPSPIWLHSFAQLMKINKSKEREAKKKSPVLLLALALFCFGCFHFFFFIMFLRSHLFCATRCRQRRDVGRSRSSFSFQSGHKNVDSDADKLETVGDRRERSSRVEEEESCDTEKESQSNGHTQEESWSLLHILKRPAN